MMTTRFTKTVLLAASVVAIGAFTLPPAARAADAPQTQTTEVKKDVKKVHHGKHKKGKKAASVKHEKRAGASKTTQTAATPNN